LLPAGPIREPLDYALSRVDAIISIGNAPCQNLKIVNAGKPVFEASLSVKTAVLPPKHLNYVAFAGIAYPDRFFNTLKEHGYSVVESIAYPDHYQFTADEIDILHKMALEKNAVLITTEKDLVRLPVQKRSEVMALEVELVLKDRKAFINWIQSVRGLS
jgi:tetraacyldisaccharide 4'-kinase